MCPVNPATVPALVTLDTCMKSVSQKTDTAEERLVAYGHIEAATMLDEIVMYNHHGEPGTKGKEYANSVTIKACSQHVHRQGDGTVRVDMNPANIQTGVIEKTPSGDTMAVCYPANYLQSTPVEAGRSPTDSTHLFYESFFVGTCV